MISCEKNEIGYVMFVGQPRAIHGGDGLVEGTIRWNEALSVILLAVLKSFQSLLVLSEGVTGRCSRYIIQTEAS